MSSENATGVDQNREDDGQLAHQATPKAVGHEADNLSELDYQEGLVIDTMFHYNSEYCFPYRTFVHHTKFSLEDIKPIVQRLKAKGYLYVAHGLMTEEGEVAGSGFGIPTEKYSEVADLYERWDKRRVREELRRKRERLTQQIAEIDAELNDTTGVTT